MDAPICPGAVRRHFAASAVLAAALPLLWLACGCGTRAKLNPGLVLTSEQIERAKQKGKTLVCNGADPYQAYSTLGKEVNARVSGDVIVRQAAACWPEHEVAFEIAKQGDSSEAGIQKALNEALRRVSRELKFVVAVQLPTNRDPSTITFEMRTGGATTYPPTAVEKPAFLRQISSALDPDMPPSSLWGYDVRFPISGSPGYPAIDKNVPQLQLVVKDGQSEAGAWFVIPQRPPAY